MGYSFTNMGATPHLPQGSDPSNGSTPASRALNTMQGMPPPVPLIPPTSMESPALKSHSIQHPDGTVVTQQFHKPETTEGMLSKPQKQKAPIKQVQPPMKIMNGEHHVLFKAADGTTKYINSKGEVS